MVKKFMPKQSTKTLDTYFTPEVMEKANLDQKLYCKEGNKFTSYGDEWLRLIG